MNTNKLSNHSEEKRLHPSIFMFLFLPFGALSGYVGVTIGYLLTQAGIPLKQVAPIVSIIFIPNILKFLWAPLVDTILSTKKWYLIANLATAFGILATSVLPMKAAYLTIITVILLITGLANTFVAMSSESLMAHDTSDDMKGRAGGWAQAGNLGGYGLGGGAALWLAERLTHPWMTGTILAVACLLCSFVLFFLPEPKSTIKAEKYIKTFTNLIKDIWAVMKSKMGFLAIILCFLPIGSGAASNLWSAISNDWHATADVVALIIGLVGGVLSALGCILGGWICDKMDRKKAYVLFGIVQALCAISMAFCPRTEKMFILWTSLYAVSTGLTFAGFSAFALEAIGKGAAATKYNVLASLSNAPIYYMIFIDEWAHGKWHAFGMLTTEAIMALIGVSLFMTFFVIVNKKRPGLKLAN